MKRLLMLNIILLTLSLSACGGSDKNHPDTEPISQDQVSVNQDMEDEDNEDLSDESQNGDAADEGDIAVDNNGNDPSDPADETDEDADNELNGLEVCTLLYSGRSDNDVSEWYPDSESFIDAYGFDIDSPFFELRIPDGSSDMLYLYYDPETQLGCGYQISGENPDTPIYGFVFDSAEEKIWDKDYYALVSVEGGSDGSDRVEDYRTNIVYDDNGNLLEFESSGLVDWYGDVDEVNPFILLSFTYEYDDNGTLRYREYHHSPHVFATTLCYLYTYFDELGRPVYEKGYITHGHLEYYYIYTDNEMTPAYCLCLDYMHGSKVPDFTIYTH